ncbi:phosphatase PAP2 family protein [Ancylomarina longa]|uniref:Phosphatase PAP2 family protein n=1 Tax=Ancylomarina longa TaxID=2487017 RepID=A0A434AXQ5_9BACT|nr:phosphatase PAP2 family protein [Ancylomarina longa]RUT79335.1 phosphatase PAP2 family protein [Ancylomarina longa]
METLIQIDKELLLWLNSYHTHFWDVVMMIFTRKEFWIPLYIVLLYQIYKFKGKEALWWIIGLFLMIFLCDQISTQLFKNIFQRLRPSHDPTISNMVHLVSGYKGGKYGFVSSHAANTFGFAMLTSLLFKNRLYTIFAFCWSLLIIYSRVYLGVHFPGDVLGGMILGLVIGYAVFRLTKWWVSKRSVDSRKSSNIRAKLNYSSVYLLIAVSAAEILTICLVVKKLIKYGMF